jgi:hypothetical protein
MWEYISFELYQISTTIAILHQPKRLDRMRLAEGIRTEQRAQQLSPEFFSRVGCQTQKLEARARDNVFQYVSN